MGTQLMPARRKPGAAPRMGAARWRGDLFGQTRGRTRIMCFTLLGLGLVQIPGLLGLMVPVYADPASPWLTVLTGTHVCINLAAPFLVGRRWMAGLHLAWVSLGLVAAGLLWLVVNVLVYSAMDAQHVRQVPEVSGFEICAGFVVSCVCGPLILMGLVAAETQRYFDPETPPEEHHAL